MSLSSLQRNTHLLSSRSRPISTHSHKQPPFQALPPLSPSCQPGGENREEWHYIALAHMTPEVSPIDHDPTHLVLTPITSGLIRQEIQQFMDDFILDGNTSYLFQTESKMRRKRGRAAEERQGGLLKLDCELQHIFEENSEDNSDYDSCSSENEEFCIEFESGECYGNSNTFMTAWAGKLKSRETSDQDEEKEAALELLNAEYMQRVELFRKHPKAEITRRIKEIENQPGIDEGEKRGLIKGLLEKYLVEFEVPCFEEAWNELPSGLKETVSLLSRGIGETFSRKVGPLSYEARRVKLLTYLEKKKRRKWRKKVSYDCRKRVADGRLRIKGKFVTREQICEQLGFQTLENYTAEEIKELLQRRGEGMIEQTAC